MGVGNSLPKEKAAEQAEVIIPAIREAIPLKKKEGFTMRVRMLEWGGDGWEVSRGYVEAKSAVSTKVKARVATYNTWFDRDGDPISRWTALFGLLFHRPAGQEVDVVALQELIQPSIDLLKSLEAVKRDWIFLDGDEVLKHTQSGYGTAMLVRRKWMADHGIDKVESSLTTYGSPMARSFLVLEFSSDAGIVWRIGTSHFESGPNDQVHRRRQFYHAAHKLTLDSSYTVVEQLPRGFPKTVDDFIKLVDSSDLNNTRVPPATIMGDTNIESYDELSPLLSAPLNYVDAFNSVHPHPPSSNASVTTAGDAIYRSHPTFFTTFTNVSNAQQLSRKRIDYVLVREGAATVTINDAQLIGDTPVVGPDGTTFLTDPRGRDGKLYPSDHLGVIVDLELDLRNLLQG